MEVPEYEDEWGRSFQDGGTRKNHRKAEQRKKKNDDDFYFVLLPVFVCTCLYFVFIFVIISLIVGATPCTWEAKYIRTYRS